MLNHYRPGEGLSEAARAKLYNYPVGKLDVEKPSGDGSMEKKNDHLSTNIQHN